MLVCASITPNNSSYGQEVVTTMLRYSTLDKKRTFKLRGDCSKQRQATLHAWRVLDKHGLLALTRRKEESGSHDRSVCRYVTEARARIGIPLVQISVQYLTDTTAPTVSYRASLCGNWCNSADGPLPAAVGRLWWSLFPSCMISPKRDGDRRSYKRCLWPGCTADKVLSV